MLGGFDKFLRVVRRYVFVGKLVGLLSEALCIWIDMVYMVILCRLCFCERLDFRCDLGSCFGSLGFALILVC